MPSWKNVTLFPTGEEEFAQAFLDATMERMRECGNQFVLRCSIQEIMSVAALTQLALRHPRVEVIESAALAKSTVQQIIGGIAGDFPIIREGLTRGFDQAYDVDVEKGG